MYKDYTMTSVCLIPSTFSIRYKICIIFFWFFLTYHHPNIRPSCDVIRPVNDLRVKNLIALISFSELPFFFEVIHLKL